MSSKVQIPERVIGSGAVEQETQSPTAPQVQKKVLATAPVPGLCMFTTGV